MEKHLLLTISDERAASSNLRFINSFFDRVCELNLTLFYVAPRQAHWGSHAALSTSLEDSVDKHISAFKSSHGNPTLAKTREKLITLFECEPQKVRTKITHSRMGIVHEIVAEAREGMYDAVVMGRRGLGWFEELFEHSVSNEILWEALDFPIWVCHTPPEDDRKDVLLCVDGARECNRMADHVGFMLADQKRHNVTMLHVDSGSSDKDEIEGYFREARQALVDNGVDNDRITAKSLTASNTPKAILNEAQEGKFAVVAVGRRSCDKERRKAFLSDSVSFKILRQIENCALWISK